MRESCERCGADLCRTARPSSARSSARSAPHAAPRWTTCVRTAAASSWRQAEAGRGMTRCPAPVRAPAVLRAPLRLLRLRHGRRPPRPARRLRRRRCSRELELERHVLADELETVFLGGGTPTFTAPAELARLLEALPRADEVTVEANPETVTPELASAAARARRDARLARRPELPAAPAGACSSAARSRTTCAARSRCCATPASTTSRSTSSTASRARRVADLDADLADGARARARAPLLLRARGEAGHALHARARRRARAAGRGDGGLLRARRRDARRGAGYRWYETANFCRGEPATCRGTTSATGSGATTSASASVRSRRSPATRRRNAPRLARYLDGARLHGGAAARDEPLTTCERRASGSCSACGSTSPLRARPASSRASTPPALDRVERLGLAERGDGTLALTSAGRFLGGGVTASCFVSTARKSPANGHVSSLGSHRAQQRDPAHGRRGVRRDGPARRARRRSSSRPVCGLAPRRCAPSSPSSSRAGCSRTRTPRPAACRPSAATATTPTGARPDGRAAAGRPFPLDLQRPRREVESALQATTEMLSQVTRLLALVSAPPLEATTIVRHVEVLLLQPEIVMVVVITSTGGVTKRLFHFDERGRPRARAVGERVPERDGLGPSARDDVAAPPLRRSRAECPRARVPRLHCGRPSPSSCRRRSGSTSAAQPTCSATFAATSSRRTAACSSSSRSALRSSRCSATRASTRAGLSSASAASSRTRACRRSRSSAQPYGVTHRVLGAVSLIGPVRMDYEKAVGAVRSAATELSRFAESVYTDR